MKKQWNTYLALISFFILAIMVPIAGAYDTYDAGCVNCHGNFRANTYNSLAAAKAANPAWPGASLALHNGHANASTATPPGMLNGNCNACHFGTSRIPVYTYQSNGTVPFNQGCSGCHDGPGLRAHHVNSGADTCYDCHSDPAPDPENVLRPVYTAAFGTANGATGVNDPCKPTAAGFEGRLKDVTSLGLDNDGNLLYDQNDPACATAAATISVSPTTLTYGNQAVGTTSATQTVTISNSGTDILSVTGIANSNTTDYVLTAPALPFNIAAAGSQTFTMAFRPASTGAKSATVSITSNAGNATVSATGTGIAPVLSVSPATLTFGNQTIGTSSAAQTLTLSNTGTGTLNVSGITSSNAEFAFSPISIAPIAAGGSATLSITFAPAATGARSSNISILSNGGTATVSATGTGVSSTVLQPVLNVSPLSQTFNNIVVNTSSTQTVTISNTGNAPLSINSISKTGSAAFSFSPASIASLVAGASSTLTVTYAPTVVGADTGATINISSKGGNAAVSLMGNAVQLPATGPGDVALVKLSVPSNVMVKVGKTLELKLLAQATSTIKEIQATVTLKAASNSNVKVSIDKSSLKKDIKSEEDDPQEFEFGAKISCSKNGTWPVTWTAKISAAENSNATNDTLTGTTQVTCSSGSGGGGSSDRD